MSHGMLTFLLELDPHLKPWRLSQGRLLPGRRIPPGVSSRLCARLFQRGLRERLESGLGSSARRLAELQRQGAGSAEDSAEEGRLWLRLGQGAQALPALQRAVRRGSLEAAVLEARLCAHALLGDLERAGREAARLARLRPKQAWPCALLGELRRQAGDASGARAALAKACRLSPGDPDLWTLRGNLEPEALDEALRLDPLHFWARVLRLHALEARGKTPAALEEAEASLRAAPEAGWLHAVRGRLLAALGCSREAERASEEAAACSDLGMWAHTAAARRLGHPPIEALSNEELSQWTLSSLLQQSRRGPGRDEAAAVLASWTGYMEWVEHGLDQLVARTPRPWMLALQARVEAARGDPGKGLELMERALSERPSSGWLRAWRAELLMRAGGAAEAVLAGYDEALRLDPLYPLAYTFRAAFLARHGPPEAAVEALNAAIEAQPDSARPHALRSQVRAALKDAACGKDLEIAFIRDAQTCARWTGKTRPPGKSWHGLALMRQGRLKDAARRLGAPTRRDDARFWTALWRGELRLRQGRPRQARRELSACIRQAPWLGWAYALRAQASMRLRLWKSGLEDIERLRAAAPENGFGLLSWRARFKRLSGRPQEALQDAALSLRLVPDDAWALYEKAMAQAALGRPQQAVESLRQAAGRAARPLWPLSEGFAGPSEQARAEIPGP